MLQTLQLIQLDILFHHPICWTRSTPNNGSQDMAKKSKPTFQKRNREIARLEKPDAKEARRLEAIERKAKAKPRFDDEDPDIAGIRPGPQPLPEQWDDTIDDE
jgi:hypothetical protein